MSRLTTRARRRRRACVLGVVTVAAVASLPGGAALAAPSQAGCGNRTNNTYDKLLECVRVEGVREHQAALQAIADANDGNRFSGFSGYDASVDYVVETLEAAGYDPEVQAFDYLAFEVVGPSALQQIAPTPITYVEGVDFGAITQTDPGDVTAAVTPVDLQLGLGNTSTSGCEAADFAGFPAGNIALLQRGTCTFELKAENAAAAGAVGIVIFNQGNTAAEDRNNIPAVTLTANNTSGIPVLGTTYALGVTLANTPGLRMRVFANTLRQTLPTYNVLAEKTGANDDNVVMAGAHLDSVLAGPGINDNGSGSAAILETAIQMAKVKPTNTVRFAWWGAEESGLVGSTNYVNGLSQAEKDRIALYLNFDMIGSPNYIQMVYDSDQSGFDGSGPRPAGLDRHRGSLRVVLHAQQRAVRRRRVQRSQRLPGVHQQRDPGRRSLHRGRGPQDRRAAGDLGRHHGGPVRPVLPPRLRHVRQQQPARARDQLRRGRVRGAHVRVLDRDGERRAGQEGARQVHDPGARRARRHRRQRRRRRRARAPRGLVAPAPLRGAARQRVAPPAGCARVAPVG